MGCPACRSKALNWAQNSQPAQQAPPEGIVKLQVPTSDGLPCLDRGCWLASAAFSADSDREPGPGASFDLVWPCQNLAQWHHGDCPSLASMKLDAAVDVSDDTDAGQEHAA